MGAMLRKPLSEEAKELLLEAVKDEKGLGLWDPMKTPADIQTNGKSFGNREDPRAQARWKASLDELLNRGFLEQEYGMEFQVTLLLLSFYFLIKGNGQRPAAISEAH